VNRKGQAVERASARHLSKGQAAMEYLMTYGWALLVIVIVIAVLIVMNPLKASPQCLFDQAGFACNQPNVPVITAANGTLSGKVTNGQQASIKIYSVSCTTNRTAPAAPAATATVLATLASQQQSDLGLPPLSVRCGKTDGTYVYATGEDFNGKLYIYYKFSDDGASYPYRLASANLVARAQ